MLRKKKSFHWTSNEGIALRSRIINLNHPRPPPLPRSPHPHPPPSPLIPLNLLTSLLDLPISSSLLSTLAFNNLIYLQLAHILFRPLSTCFRRTHRRQAARQQCCSGLEKKGDIPGVGPDGDVESPFAFTESLGKAIGGNNRLNPSITCFWELHRLCSASRCVRLGCRMTPTPISSAGPTAEVVVTVGVSILRHASYSKRWKQQFSSSKEIAGPLNAGEGRVDPEGHGRTLLALHFCLDYEQA